MVCRYVYCRRLEENSFFGRTADFVFMFIFGGVLMLLAAIPLGLPLLGPSFVFMLLYVWSRRSPHVRMSFLGIFDFNAPYLAYVLLGFGMLFGGSPVTNGLGIAVGHLYYFLEDVVPIKTGRRVLVTPHFLWATPRHRHTHTQALGAL